MAQAQSHVIRLVIRSRRGLRHHTLIGLGCGVDYGIADDPLDIVWVSVWRDRYIPNGHRHSHWCALAIRLVVANIRLVLSYARGIVFL